MSEKEDKFTIQILFHWDKDDLLENVEVLTDFVEDPRLHEQIVEVIKQFIEKKTDMKGRIQRKSYVY